jgi:hypothetical protein
MRKILAAIALLLSVCGAEAQTSPNLTYGQVLTAGQWNALFSGKQDTLGFTPLSTAGGVMLGRLVTAAPSSTTAGLNLTPGTTPGSPVDGDVWITASSIFARINGVTVDVLGAPCTNCALTNVANVFTAQQTAQGATTTQPGWFVQLTGDSVPRIHLGLTTGDVPTMSFGTGAGTRDAFIQRVGAGSLRFGGPDSASPTAQALGVQNVLVGTSNTAGAIWQIAGSRGTGTGPGGSIAFQVAPSGTSGSTQNSVVTAMLINGADGGITLNGATSLGSGTIAGTNNQNAPTAWSLTNPSTGTSANTSFEIFNSVGSTSFGLGGSGYTGQSGFLQNKGYLFTGTGTSGIALYATGSNPIDFYINGARAGGFPTSGGISVNGSTSGTLLVLAANTAGSSVIKFPAGSIDFTVSGGVGQVLQQSSTGGSITVGLLTTTGTLSSGAAGTGFVIGGVTMTLGSDSNGDLYCRSGGVLTRVPGGASSTLLTSGGPTVCPTWVAAPGGGNVSNSGTPTAGQLAKWTSATVIAGVTSAILQASPTPPTGTTSGTQVMMGLGSTCTITPTWSNRVHINLRGYMISAALSSSQLQARFGTGAAPSNGVAASGTTIGAIEGGTHGGASYQIPFNAGGNITGLTVGTAYWFDLGLLNNSGVLSSISAVSCDAIEE